MKGLLRQSRNIEDRRRPMSGRQAAQQVEDVLTGRSPYEDYRYDEGTGLRVPNTPFDVERYLLNLRRRKPGVEYPEPR